MQNRELKTKILVVDDSAFMRQFIIGFLHEYGFVDIEEAGNGKLALETFKENHPDIVLMDLIMPVEAGPEALSKLISEGAKVIIISAVGQEHVMEEMIKKGAKGYFIKPFFSSKEIGDKIMEMVGQSNDDSKPKN